VYAKTVSAGRSDAALSGEEAEALRLALESATPRSRAASLRLALESATPRSRAAS
jgi:hypothetical protein